MNKLKLMTIIGTRPEIIRLSEVIKKCDKYFDQILVHTGQNYDYNLNGVFPVGSLVFLCFHNIRIESYLSVVFYLLLLSIYRFVNTACILCYP